MFETGPGAAAQVCVVGVALVRRGPAGPRVLAARRSRPPRLAGGWELPGGKCEAGETVEQAAVRELREELDCAVAVTGRLAGAQPIDERHVLEVVLAELAEGEPVPHEHDAVRWLAADELDQVRWLPADLPFLPALRAVLEEGR